MATLRELIIKISANSQSFQTEISRASRMGADYYKTMQNGGRQAAAASRETQRALSEVTSQLNSTKSAAMGMAGAFAGAFATGQLINYADIWSQLSGRLKLASTSSDDFSSAQKTLFEISQRTGTSLEANTNLYSRIAQSLRDAGYASSDVAKVTETVATSLKLSGASTEEASSVITQLSQALGSGVLRGEEFNAIMENGGRLAKLLASGLGTSIGGLRNMATAGKLTTDQLIPILTNVDALRKEFEQLPQTVSGSAQKLENSFMAWVGGANEASGATETLSNVLNTVANNIDGVAKAGGALVAVGVARYFGNIISGSASATAGLIAAAKNEVALAEVQVRGTQISTARARAAVYRAQQALAAARGTDVQTASEKRLAAAQASLSRNIAARTAAQATLNSVTSVGSRLLGGALGLIGGVPGLVMLGAGAWYTMYQNQEQARKSAQDYANTIDEVRQKTASMGLVGVSDNEQKTRQSYDEQNRLVDLQAEKVRKLADEVKGYQQILANPGPTVGGYLINHLMSLDSATQGLGAATNALAVEQERLSQMQEKSQEIQSVLEGLENRRVALLRQQAAEQNTVYQSLLMMNGQHTEFNRLLGLGNNLLIARQGLNISPNRIPTATLNDKQSDLLNRSQRDLELSKLKGAARARRQAEFNADDVGLSSTPEYIEARNQYINNQVDKFNNDQSQKKTPKGPKSDAEKQEDVYNRLLKQQQEQIALAGQSTELAKVKYQISQGELSTITQVQKSELLRNAAALDQVKAQERFKALQEELLTPEEELLQKTRERIKLLKEAAPASQDYEKMMRRITKVNTDSAPDYKGVDTNIGGAISGVVDAAKSQKELDKWYSDQLSMQKEFLDEKLINEQIYNENVSKVNDTYASKLKDIQDGTKVAAMAGFAEMAGSAAEMASQIYGQSSGAYKALFLMQKAFAVASIIMNAHIAAAKAPAELTILGGIPVGTALLASGYASAGMVAGMALAGMAHDGIDRVPETGTWLLQKGERVVTAQTSAKLDTTLEKVQQNKQAERSAQLGSVVFQNSFTGKPDDATLLAFDQRQRESEKRIQKILTAQVLTPSGEFGNALKTIYPNRRKT